MRSLFIFVSLMTLVNFANAAEYKLTLHHFFSPREPAQTMMLRPWADEVEKLSKGKVKINIAPGMTLGGKPSELIKQVQSGRVDLIWTINGYSDRKFIRSEVFELPFVHTNDPVATNLAMREMLESDLKEDYENLEVMFLHVHQGQAFQNKGYSVRKPEDLWGKRARVPSRTGAWVLEELGAKTVSVPVTRIPQTLQRNIATTVLIPFNVQPLLGLNQHISSFTEGHNQTRFGSVVFQVSMNKDKWESLPPEIQAVFRKASDENFLRRIGKLWREDEQRGVDLMTKFKREHIVLTKEETEAFRIKLEPVIDKWVEDVKKEGIDGRKLVNKARKLIKKYEE
ncbi:MAG: TRAP transporter substrate-binding protein [SAR324 cluster bacterium]|nr:TRAP transporter substrate-binding protein [SAR324 cluster bacterium]